MTYSEPWQEQRDFLLALFRTEMLPGGRLAAIKTLSGLIQPEGQLVNLTFPMLAFEHDRAEESWGSTAGSRQQNRFNIALYVITPFSPTAPSTDPVKATKDAVENLWNDRAGNGLGPVLRSDPTLGGLCVFSYPSTYLARASRGGAEQAGTSGTATTVFTTLAEFRGGIL